MAAKKRPRHDARVREKAAPQYAPSDREALTGVLLDSDVVIEVLRGRSSVVTELRALERRGIPTFTTAIAWAEVGAGLRRGEEPAAEAFFGARGEVVIDGSTGRRAGTYLARYSRSHGVELADALVAAAAATTGLRLWTRNRRHFPMSDLSFHSPGES